jgi:thiamine biosynthesis lipoprotein
MNRRHFLGPKLLSRLVGPMVQSSHLEPQEEQPDAALLRFRRRAMATDFEVVLPMGTHAAQSAGDAALGLIDELEDQLSIYREDSEVSRLNRLAPFGPVQVERRLFDLLATAAEVHRETDGACDITVGPLIKTWGFYRRQGQVPSEEERRRVMSLVGMNHVLLNEDTQSVAFDGPGVEINLGSLGKGYALDRAAALLREDFEIGSVVLHGGHSSVLAVGDRPGALQGWPVGLMHPIQTRRRLGLVRLHNRALGTSAATFQHLMYNGKKLGHILDPRTGWPADGTLMATATAPSALLADALATAFFVNGLEKTRAYCERHPDVGAIMLSETYSQPVVLGCARREFTS